MQVSPLALGSLQLFIIFTFFLTTTQLVFAQEIFLWRCRLISISQVIFTDTSLLQLINQRCTASGAFLTAVPALKDLLLKHKR